MERSKSDGGGCVGSVGANESEKKEEKEGRWPGGVGIGLAVC